MASQTSTAVCSVCACRDARGSASHAIVAALADDDLDRALGLGLLEADPCPGCEASCAKALADAREARMRALAARERYRARDARLQRRAEELKAKRAAAADGPKSRALPAAAAAALARAKAKAAGNPSQ